MNLKRGNVVVGFIIFILIIWGVSSLFSGSDNEENSGTSYPVYTNTYSGSNSYADDYYDSEYEYPVGFKGTDTMEACNNETGNCYDLDIDSDGENVERINFPNGGWRDVNYSDCEDGYCVVEDEDGTEWELQY